jgi:predicted transcriptional regulator
MIWRNWLPRSNWWSRLEQAEFRKALRASLSQADRGEVISHEQALKESKRWIKKTTRFK